MKQAGSTIRGYLPVAALLATLGACNDAIVESPPIGDGPSQSHIANCRFVDNSKYDDTGALQDSLDVGGVLCLSGTYDIYDAVQIRHSGTEIYGEGAAVIVQHTLRKDVFVAPKSGGPVNNLVIDGIAFQGEEYPWVSQEPHPLPAQAHALELFRGSTIRFTNNTATNLGLTYIGFGRDGEYSKTVAPPLSENIVVSGNSGIGRASQDSFPIIEAIWIGYADGVHVANNAVSYYISGITWWGGEGDPSKIPGRGPSDPRYARNYLIESNDVRHVMSGIWGSMGDSITVTNGNHVEDCFDVCLDAEGSTNVVFENGSAFYGRGGGPLAVYWYSSNIVFRWLTVKQDDREWKDGSRSDRLLSTSTHYDSSTVLVHNVDFIYEAPHTGAGVGRITKSTSAKFEFANNKLSNTIIDLQANNNGAVAIIGNTFDFTRTTGGKPAIFSTKNHAPHAPADPLNSIYQLHIYGNRISSQAAQTAVGIRVDQPASSVNSWIGKNTVRDFGTSIHVTPTSTSGREFRVDENGVSNGTYPNGDTNHVDLINNYVIDDQPHVVAYAVRGPTYNDWQATRYGFETAGTTGESRDLNEISVSNVAPLSSAQICIRAYIEGIGWVPTTQAAAPCGGTVSAGSRFGGRIQAVQMWMKAGMFGPSGTICYQTHVGNVGWQSQKCNGSTAGVTSTNALQAIRIRVSGI